MKSPAVYALRIFLEIVDNWQNRGWGSAHAPPAPPVISVIFLHTEDIRDKILKHYTLHTNKLSSRLRYPKIYAMK